ncbi:MAG: TetR/AcrR family transcriptional regulator [Deltaproteobacteria bacterium]|nr:TetR/AcrR family transcriptional regulator [Deltaproteobacteria bacterium]
MGRKNNAEVRRNEIVQALYACLSEKGHEKVTTKEIALQAGLAPGVIHYYFKSKDEIVTCLMDHLAGKYQALFGEKMQELSNSSEFLKAFANFLCDEFVFDQGLNRVFYNLVQMGFESQVVVKPLRLLMENYRARGNLHFRQLYSPIKNAGYLVVALIEGLALQWMIEPDDSRKEDIRNLVQFTMEGILSAV